MSGRSHETRRSHNGEDDNDEYQPQDDDQGEEEGEEVDVDSDESDDSDGPVDGIEVDEDDLAQAYELINNGNFAAVRQMLQGLGLLRGGGRGPAPDEMDDSSTEEPEPQPTVPTLENHSINGESLSAHGHGYGSRQGSVFRMLHARELNHPTIRPTFKTTNPAPTELPSTASAAASTAASAPVWGDLDHGQMNVAPFKARAKCHIGSQYIPHTLAKVLPHDDSVFCGLYSGDGELFLSASQDHRIRIYDASTWNLVNTIVARDVGWSVLSVDYSADAQWCIYSSWSNRVHICNTRGEHQVHEALEFSDSTDRFCLFSVQFSPDNKEILGGSVDQHLYVYDLERRELIERVRAHTDDINAVAWADKSSQILFTGSDDTFCKAWDRRCFGDMNKGCVGVFRGHNGGLTFIDSRNDGRYLVTNGKDSVAKLWDLRTAESSANHLRAAHGGPRLRGYGGYVTVNPAGAPGSKDTSLMTYRGHSVAQTLIRVRFSPAHTTGQRYIYSSSASGSVFVYEVLTGKLVHLLQAHDHIIRDAAWHPFAPTLVTTSWDSTAKVWEFNPSKPLTDQARQPRRGRRYFW